MNFKNIQFIESIKKMNPRDFIYPCVLIFFFAIVAVVFFLATRFISKNINNVFTNEESDKATELDIENYTQVAKKLNITIIAPNQNIPIPNTISN